MDRNAFLGCEEVDSTLVAEIARTADRDATVPSCPEWTLADLVRHVATRPPIWLALLELAPDASPDMAHLDALTAGGDVPPGAEPTDWLLAEHAAFRDIVRATDPDRPCWFFGAPYTATDIARRSAIEMAVHRWDAQGVAGRPEPLDPRVAGAGMDELLDCIIPLQYGFGAVPPAVAVTLHATDIDQSWTATAPGSAVRPTASISATASDLHLAFAHRLGPDDQAVRLMTVDGDPRAVLAWLQFVPAF